MTAAPDFPQPPISAAFCAIADLVREHARSHPRKTALVCGDETWSYARLDSIADAVAASLQRRQLKRGDAIAVCAATSLDYCGVFLGALRAGGVVAPLAPSATREQLAAMVADTRARWLFADSDNAARLAGLTDAELVLLGGASPGESLPGQSLDAWLDAPAGLPARVVVEPDWAFNIIYSSGTTGTPKGVMQTHARRWQHTLSLAALGSDPDAVALVATPLYSNTTLVVLFPVLALGGTAVLMPKFDAREYLALAQRHRVTHTMLVPVQYQRIMALPEFGHYDLSSFRMKMCTGAPFPAQLKADVLRRWPGGLVEFYGSTEGAGGCVLVAHEHPDKLHTVGRPAAGSEIRIVDDDGREVPRGVAGEIVGRSGTMMTGYHNQPTATSGAEWYDAGGRRYLRTGDVGYLDDDGFLVLVDRKKDMIISGGFNIYPADLEAQLSEHPDVADVAVIGVTSQRWGETPVAYVVLRPGAAFDSEALREWVNARVGKTQRVSAVYQLDELPRGPLGKILKRALRERHPRDT